MGAGLSGVSLIASGHRGEFARAHVSFAAGLLWSVRRFFQGVSEGGDDANPRVGIGQSDTKVSSLIH